MPRGRSRSTLPYGFLAPLMSEDESDSELTVTVKNFPRPFDQAARGDCILISSDGIKFKVLRAILTVASSVFDDTFQIPQPAAGGEPLPTIDLAEDSATLQVLLESLYPRDPPVIKSCKIAASLVTAYDKYGISVARLMPLIRDFLDTQEAHMKPLEMYAIVYRLGLKDEAKTLSRYLHETDLMSQEERGTSHRLSGGADAIVALLELRLAREKGLDEVARLGEKLSVRLCQEHKEQMPTFWQIKDTVRTSLSTPHPSCKDVDVFFGLPKPRVVERKYERNVYSNCPECSKARTTDDARRLETVNSAVDRYPQTIT